MQQLARVYISLAGRSKKQSASNDCAIEAKLICYSRGSTVRKQSIHSTLTSFLTTAALMTAALPFLSTPAAGQFPADSTLPKEKRGRGQIGKLTPPMTPRAEKFFKEVQANQGIYDPEARCQPAGVPRRDPYPMKLLQEPNLVVI